MSKKTTLAAIIQEWRRRPAAARKTENQAAAFAKRAETQHSWPGGYQEIVAALAKHTGLSH